MTHPHVTNMAAVAGRSEMRRNCYDVLQNLSTGDILYVEYEKEQISCDQVKSTGFYEAGRVRAEMTRRMTKRNRNSCCWEVFSVSYNKEEIL